MPIDITEPKTFILLSAVMTGLWLIVFAGFNLLLSPLHISLWKTFQIAVVLIIAGCLTGATPHAYFYYLRLKEEREEDGQTDEL